MFGNMSIRRPARVDENTATETAVIGLSGAEPHDPFAG
jgi:hypothetical protein